MLIMWLIGFMFTISLCEGEGDNSFALELSYLIYWPLKLGGYLHKRNAK